MKFTHSIVTQILICIGGLALIYRICGKSAVQSALLFAVALLTKDIAARYFGNVGLIVYLFLMTFLFIAIVFVKNEDTAAKGWKTGVNNFAHLQSEGIRKFIFFILAVIGALVLVCAIYKTAGIL